MISLTTPIFMNSKTIIIGLGNPILGDDGVGWKVVEYVQKDSNLPISVVVDFLALGGISLMERLIGYDRAILVDVIVTGKNPIGSVLRLEIDDLPVRAGGHLASAHDTSLQNALQMGRALGAKLPERITIVAVESQSVYDFSEELSAQVAAAVPEAAKIVVNVLAESSREVSQ
jgi:hydrogenase maturation protease